MLHEHTLEEVLVSVKDVSLKFGDTLILKDVNAEVRDIVRPGSCQGQVVGILGPSGVGKTQFSRILAGLQEPTTGTVQLHLPVEEEGKEDTYEDVLVAPGKVGMVFQNYPLFAHRTVMGNLLVALEHTGLSKADRTAKIMPYLEKFDLVNKADLFPAQLSGGQRQRVAIIQELLGAGHYIVMDEPFTGLDPLMKDMVCDLINLVANLDERNTIFVVAHDISALVQISDYLWLFGRERDEKGQPIAGAHIKKTYDLIERGLAWRPDISTTREFQSFVAEVRQQFHQL